jgi:hypothetical protein
MSKKNNSKEYSNPIGMKDHWQMDVSNSVFERGRGNDPAGAFLPRPGKDRAQPHVKINECDH